MIITAMAIEQNFDKAQPIASIELDPNFEIVFIDLNFAQTHLYVLACSSLNENDLDYSLSVYALESVAFDRTGGDIQVDKCLESLNV